MNNDGDSLSCFLWLLFGSGLLGCSLSFGSLLTGGIDLLCESSDLEASVLPLDHDLKSVKVVQVCSLGSLLELLSGGGGVPLLLEFVHSDGLPIVMQCKGGREEAYLRVPVLAPLRMGTLRLVRVSLLRGYKTLGNPVVGPSTRTLFMSAISTITTSLPKSLPKLM